LKAAHPEPVIAGPCRHSPDYSAFISVATSRTVCAMPDRITQCTNEWHDPDSYRDWQ